MYKARIKRKRIAVKEGQISLDLRQQIVRGELMPGEQLPKRVELERQYAVSPVTLQRALQQLIEDGFVYAKTGQGTFVAPNPPHLSRYGLLFPFHPSQTEMWASYYEALNHEAQGIQRQDANKLSVYYGLESPERGEDRAQLIRDIEWHRLAGLIFASIPHNFKDTPLLNEPGIARVAVMRNPGFGIPAVALNGEEFQNKTLDYFASRGRRRIAVINSSTMFPDVIETFRQKLLARDMVTCPYWIQGVHPSAAGWAKNIAHLMFQGPKEMRPDALLISDDNLVPHATAGLLAAGVSVPDELDVVAHSNFPLSTASMVPAKRLGHDARVVLRTCLELIDRQRHGEKVESLTTIPAVFEDELTELVPG